MFDREARTLQKLKHPGIPHVEADGYFTIFLHQDISDKPTRPLYCLVMEYIEGQNLEQWMMSHAPITTDEAIAWLQQLTEILDQVHQSELFHRDIKPSNIMLRPNGQLVLIDFGSARPMTNTYFAKVGSGGQREITSVVSPGYTPLEQVNGKAVPQSDFYALGRTFVYLLTGKHPVSFAEDPQTGALDWQSSAPQISLGLANLIDDLIAPFPGQRPLTAQEIQQRLTAAPALTSSTKSQQRSPHLNWLIALNLGLLLLQITAWSLWFKAQSPPQPLPDSWTMPSSPREGS
jgi:serine/threonine protein kinase